MKFILSRTDDYTCHSKKWIVGYGFIFWLITRILAILLIFACTCIYERYGIDPARLTKFGGDPTNLPSLFSGGYAIALVLLIAPVLEECIFRLGLSFRKIQIAIAAAAIPAYIFFQSLPAISLPKALILAACALMIFCLIYYLTSQQHWGRLKTKYFVTAVWISAISFGLLHMMAFSTFSLMLLPYMLCVISVPLLAGCTITYYRLNLGFWWGVAFHVFNNLPATILLLQN